MENNAPIKSIALSSDGRYVVTGNDNGEVQLWDVTKTKELQITPKRDRLKHEKEVFSLGINAAENN